MHVINFNLINKITHPLLGYDQNKNVRPQRMMDWNLMRITLAIYLYTIFYIQIQHYVLFQTSLAYIDTTWVQFQAKLVLHIWCQTLCKTPWWEKCVINLYSGWNYRKYSKRIPLHQHGRTLHQARRPEINLESQNPKIPQYGFCECVIIACR